MANILSQEEIDTLLGELTGGTLEAGAQGDWSPGAETEVIPYNFAQQDKIVRGGLPALDVVHDRFARLMRATLTPIVRRAVQVELLSHTELKFGEFGRTLPRLASLHVMNMTPLKGSGLLVLSGELVFAMLEIFFGGTGAGKSFSMRQRDFTMIERKLIGMLTEMIDRQYADAWQAVHAVTVQSGPSESNIEFMNIARSSETIQVADFEITIDESKYALTIALPASMIEPIKEKLKGSGMRQGAAAGRTAAGALGHRVKEAAIDVCATLGRATITARELINLKAGDIIQLEEDFEHPIEIQAEGVPKFWATVGSHKSTRAVQITGFYGDERKTLK